MSVLVHTPEDLIAFNNKGEFNTFIRDNLKELLAPLDQVMTEVAPKLAATPPVSLQGGIKDFISGFDAKKLATPSGKNEAASKDLRRLFTSSTRHALESKWPKNRFQHVMTFFRNSLNCS